MLTSGATTHGGGAYSIADPEPLIAANLAVPNGDWQSEVQLKTIGEAQPCSRPGGGDPIQACLTKAGFHQVTTYQPAYRYWDFQRIEAGIYLGMTAVAVGATYWLVLKRDA